MSRPYWTKFDHELRSIYANYLLLKEQKSKKGIWVHPVLKDDPEEIFISVEFSGNLSDLEDLGFKSMGQVSSDYVYGMISFEKLPELAVLPHIIKLEYGQEEEPMLESSAEEIEARNSGSGSRHVWSVDRATGAFTGNTGENVVVGIIDTGIDFRHHSFHKATLPESRIISIWDHGLVPQSGENSPAVGLLSTGTTTSYGVEYTNAQINQVITGASGAPNIRHRDCVGHGTHVAGIAAGNGRQAALAGRQQFEMTGIAPKAKIVFVKLFPLETNPTGVNATKRFKDAISYILNVAAAQNSGAGLPVVINCSFGNDLGPHDGFPENGSLANSEEGFLKSTFGTAQGKFIVFACGNMSGQKRHAIITIPPGGTVDIPVELYDTRTFKQDFRKCRYESSTRKLKLDLWYPKITPNTLNVSFSVQGSSTFHGPVTLNNSLTNQRYDSNKFFSIWNDVETATDGATSIERNNIFIEISPNNDDFLQGTYTVRLTGDAGTVVHMWCSKANGHGLKIGTVASPGPINVTDSHTIPSKNGLAEVVTVGAYNDTNDYMACFSSQGPMVSYTAAPPIAAVPDIVAPGRSVFSSRSYNERVSIRAVPNFMINNVLGFHYMKKSGTSMAAPHVTGVVALMLQTSNNLTANNAITALKHASSARTPPKKKDPADCSVRLVPSGTDTTAGPNIAGAGKVSAKGSVDRLSGP